MPSWPAETKYISHSTTRIDGTPKVTGKARYSSDIQAEGWLYGMILRAPWPAAKILSINLDAALKIPGIKAAVTVKDGPRTIRFYGEELAAVAGTSKQACLDALRAIEVSADVRHEFVVNENEARKENAPQVWEGKANVSAPHVRENGSVDTAFPECAAVIEGFYSTPVQIHNPMETMGNTISWTDEGVKAWSSTQGISSVRDGLAGALQLDQSKVRVITEFMGGGFGAKFGAGVEGVLAAKLSREAKAPVRLMLTRFDQALAVGNRPSSFQKIKMGATADGMLHAFEMENYGTAGIGAGGDGGGGGGGADIPAPYLYKVPNTRVKQSAVAVNAGSSRAFRAPGNPPASFGMESAMDDLAVKLGMDPLEFRLKNDPNPIRQREYKLGAEKFGWKQKYQKPGSSAGVVKTGIGCAAAAWPAGGGSRNTQGEAQINPDGSIEIRLGVQDIGTGTRTVIAVVAAEILGLKPEQITVKVGDTNYPPGPGSGGSTTCPSISPTVFDVCTKALQQLQTQSGLADARGANWFAACKKLGVNPLVVHGQWQPGLSSDHACGVQFAEVEVDTETGLVTVKKVLGVHDCGLIINQNTLESQINGGIIMGMGYALYEERVMDDLSGVMLNPNFETYKLPGIADVPDIEIVLINMPERGVIGIGEPATVPTAGAIANAVANAIGVRVGSLPITPAKILAALGKVPPRNRMKAFQYATAHSTDSARQLVADNGAYLAGGNDLLGLLKEYLISAETLVNIKSLPGLNKIDDGRKAWTIGALVTIAQIENHADIKKTFPGLHEAAADVASLQIRNVATVGGNLAQHSRCWYFRQRDVKCLKKHGDLCYARNGENRYHSLFTGNDCISPAVSSLATTFAALDATAIVLRDGKELRWSMAELYAEAWENPYAHNSLQPTDLILRVEIPTTRSRSAYLQASDKHAFDWALVSCAAAAEIEGGKLKSPRLALGSISPVPHQSEAANSFLEGKVLDDATATQAADLILKDAKPLEHNAYKMPMAHALIRRTLLKLKGDA